MNELPYHFSNHIQNDLTDSGIPPLRATVFVSRRPVGESDKIINFRITSIWTWQFQICASVRAINVKIFLPQDKFQQTNLPETVDERWSNGNFQANGLFFLLIASQFPYPQTVFSRKHWLIHQLLPQISPPRQGCCSSTTSFAEKPPVPVLPPSSM